MGKGGIAARLISKRNGTIMNLDLLYLAEREVLVLNKVKKTKKEMK
jgi:hypothetical protein